MWLITAVLVLVCPCSAAGSTFRAAFLYNAQISDFGWTYTHNEGRIKAQENLQAHFKSRGDAVVTQIFEDVRPSDAASLMDNLTRDGYNMVVGCSFVFHEQMFEAAKRHPSVDFLHISGYLGGVPNFATAHGRVYQSAYVSGVTAGAESSVRRIGYVASVPIPEVYSAANAFYLGAQVGAGATVSATHVEHKVDVVVLWIGTFFDPVKEWEAARRLHVMGCDVVAYQTDTQEGSLYAKAAGIYSVGSNSDTRRYIGESVLTSSDFNWSPIYTEMINRSYSGTFATGSHSLWYGYSAGVCVNHKPSFEVQDSTKLSFDNETARLRQGFDPFCLPARRNGAMLQSVGGCLSDPQLHGMTYIIDGPHELPLMQLHGETCGNGSHFEVRVTHDPPQYLVVCHTCEAGTHAQVHSALEGVAACTLCSAGHYSTAGATQCSPCPEGRFSATGASVCLPCPDSTSNVGVGNTDCPLDVSGRTYIIAIAVGSSLGVILLLVGVFFWLKARRDRLVINDLYSENAIAAKCAKSIAEMRLEDVDYICDIEDPSSIVASFVQIIYYLKEYKTYLPAALFLQIHRNHSKESDVVELTRRTIAPGLSTQTATLVFTDIRSSTSLWEMVPDAMRDSIRLHNAAIRSAIDAHEGYEVKTIGDAFMVAFETPLAGLRFALQVQEVLLHVSWPEALLEVPMCSRDIQRLWGGLTLRIGVNSGPVTVENNALTGRADYFGTTVNVTARLESVCTPGSVAMITSVYNEIENDIGADVFASPPKQIALKGVRTVVNVSFLWPHSLTLRWDNPLNSISDSNRSRRKQSLAKHRCKLSATAATVSVLQLSIRHAESSAPVSLQLNHCVDALSVSLERTTGLIVSMMGEWVTVGWNVGRSTPAHAESSVRFFDLMGHTRRDIAAAGLATGSVLHGDIGTSNQRFMTVVGPAVRAAWELCRRGGDKVLYSALDLAQDDQLPPAFRARVVEDIVVDKPKDAPAVPVFAIQSESECAELDCMPFMEASGTSAMSGLSEK